MQGQAFLVTFCATAKSDWPRAAMERARRKRQCSFSKTKSHVHGERRCGTHPLHSTAHTLTLSRAAGERTDLALAQSFQPSFEPLHAVIKPRQFARKTPAQKPFALVPKPRSRCNAEPKISDQFFAERE